MHGLTDRLMHLHVPDPRKSKSEDERIRKTILNALGLLPELTESMEMDTVMQAHVHPMYRMLDQAAGANIGGSSRGADMSPRNLIGQAKLRLVQSPAMFALLETNNSRAMQQGKPQYVRVVHTDHSFSTVDPAYVAKIKPILVDAKVRERLAVDRDHKHGWASRLWPNLLGEIGIYRVTGPSR